MGKRRGLKSLPEFKTAELESPGIDAQVLRTMNGKSLVSRRSARQKPDCDNVHMEAQSPPKGSSSRRQKIGDQFQVQRIASILTRKRTGVVPRDSGSLEQSYPMKTVKTTARRLADKVVKRRLHITSKPLRGRKRSTASMVNDISSTFHGKNQGILPNASSEDQSHQPRNNMARLLRSRSSNATRIADTKCPETGKEVKKRHYKKRKKRKETQQDDVSRIKSRIKYLLNRIKLEQNLIDAYSAEGWKGQSREKIRPEKELKRAETRILQCKLGIREAIHQLDLLSVDGCIEDSVFDSEGQIYHEDIFCAKCRSQDALPENDIILCDGACNRGFHQFCLNPPLKTEDIPPGDEGWLCAVCDCKLDCLDIINAYLGTDYHVEDEWQKMFPEAAASANLEEQPEVVAEDWPSEDSEDDDYDPCGDANDVDKKALRQKLSGDESESTSSSGSNSSSDSTDGDSEVSFFDEFADKIKNKRKNDIKNNFREEVGDIMLDDEDGPLPGEKRQRKEVDYKKLHDEMFGVDGSGSELSEDEEWGPRKRGRKAKETDDATQKDVNEVKPNQDKSNGLNNGEKKSGNSSKLQGKRIYRRLPKHAVERLREVFSENQLPSKSCRQELSKQLDVPLKQSYYSFWRSQFQLQISLYFKVNFWFKNMRYAALKKGVAENSGQGNTSGMPENTEDSRDLLVQIEMMDQAQLKIEKLKSTLESTMKIEKESNFVMYVPVAELKEKVSKVTIIR